MEIICWNFEYWDMFKMIVLKLLILLEIKKIDDINWVFVNIWIIEKIFPKCCGGVIMENCYIKC